jgi:hypothetical protein
MDDKSSVRQTTYNEDVNQPTKSEADEATDPTTTDRRQATALNIVENPLMACCTLFDRRNDFDYLLK